MALGSLVFWGALAMGVGVFFKGLTPAIAFENRAVSSSLGVATGFWAIVWVGVGFGVFSLARVLSLPKFSFESKSLKVVIAFLRIKIFGIVTKVGGISKRQNLFNIMLVSGRMLARGVGGVKLLKKYRKIDCGHNERNTPLWEMVNLVPILKFYEYIQPYSTYPNQPT